jgi:predicted nucleic acid-binding protein
MADVASRFYWDANVFLSYVNQLPGRTPDLDALLEQARSRRIEIISSTLTIVEVAFAAEEQLGGPLSPEIEDGIDSLWRAPSPAKLVEFSTIIARRARELIRLTRERGWSLKPADAIHLATAQQWQSTSSTPTSG